MQLRNEMAQAPDSLYQLANGTLTTVTFLFVPLSVAIAILRSRLWDIDILVRRTLVYSTLTVILALLYVGLVFALGDLLRSFFGQQQQNPLVIVVLYPSLRVEIPESKIERVRGFPPRLIYPMGMEPLDLEIDGDLSPLATAKADGLAKLASQLPIGSL